MSQIKELITLISCPSGPKCEIQHKALPIVFSAGELTGNIFHDFNVGFIPLYITVNCNVVKYNILHGFNRI